MKDLPAPIQLKPPISRQDIANLNAGDIILLTGTIYTARDAAHLRLKEAFEGGKELPFDPKDAILFYAGPCPAKPGRIIGSIAPTTSIRMDVFAETTLKMGIIAMIGKGERSGFIAELCKKYGAIYLLATGGAAALISEQVKACTEVTYPDLGTESIKRLEVENLRLIVGIDTRGKVFQTEQISLYKKNK
ncbi:MAG: FumA C-terminus/TtdB family hydratase beta subunit [Treponema sp.]|nr:FumA C-terminus/TtdB family hydratase beta subunit [Treponema sp.]